MDCRACNSPRLQSQAGFSPCYPLENLRNSAFIGLVAPKGTPATIVKRLETEVLAIVRLADVQARIRDLGLIADASSGAAFRDRIARDIPKYTAVAKAAGIKLD
jgi:tripartite-type tricarboxylate transporter receptor subunit TctC